jgi:hypothetical protein
VLGDLVCTTAEPVTVSCYERADGTLAWSRELSITNALTGERRLEAVANTEKALAMQTELEALQAEYGKGRLLSRRGGASTELFARLEEYSARIETITETLLTLRPYLTPAHEPYVGWSSPTPVVYESSLFTLFGNGVVARLNPDGSTRWSDSLGAPPSIMNGWAWGTTANPIISGDTLLVPYGHLQALSIHDGSQRWVDTEEWVHLGSPALLRVDGEEYVVSPSGRVLRVSDGSVAAEAQPWSHHFTAPLVKGNRVFWVGGWSDDNYIVQAVGLEYTRQPDGRLTPRELFRNTIPGRDRLFGSPSFVGSGIHIVTEAGVAWNISSITGEIAQRSATFSRGALSTPFYGSNFGYFTSTGGTLYRIDFDHLSKQSWNIPPSSSSPLLVDDELYIRTRQSLERYRIPTP